MEVMDLEWPIEHLGSTIRAVVIRPLAVDEIEALIPGYIASDRRSFEIPQERWAELLATLTGLPVEIIGELDICDFNEVNQVVCTAMCATIEQERQALACQRSRKIRPLRA